MSELPDLEPPAHRQQVLRVLTWNVHDLRDDAGAVEQVLRELEPDVACLQEAPRWPFSRHRLAALAVRSGLFFTAGGRASAGVAVLTGLRVDVRAAQAGRLPVLRWRPGRMPTRPRGYAMATVRLPGTAPVVVASVHLGLDQMERDAHVGLLLDRFATPRATPFGSPARPTPARPPAPPSRTLPLVMAGDLNEVPGGPSWLVLGSQLDDACVASTEATFPSRRPRARIDAVLVDRRLRVLTAGVAVVRDPALLASASDHLPVVAEVELPR